MRLTNSSEFPHLDSRLGDVLASRLVNPPLIVLLLPDVCDGAKADSNANSKETDANLDDIKSMALSEYENKGRVEQETYTIEIAVVQSGERYDGLSRQEPEWPCEGDAKKFLDASLLHVIWNINVARMAKLPCLFCTSSKNYTVASLATEQ